MITPRLECIIKHVNKKTVADIGTDHAYIPIELVRSGKCTKVIASDIRKGPADAARRHVEKYGLSDKIDVRLGGGLKTIYPGESEQIIIAGMGGEMIVKILSDDEETAKASSLILQPMNGQYEVRKFLAENGYKITAEDLAAEGGKIYNIITAEKGEMPAPKDDFEYQIPPCLNSHPLFDMLLAKKEREFTKILLGNEKAAEKDHELINSMTENLTKLRKIKEDLKK